MTDNGVINRWRYPFRTESDVTGSFLQNMDELVQRMDLLAVDKGRFVRDIEFSKSKYHSWISRPGELSNMFLAPGAEVAASVATSLQKFGFLAEAYWISNTFGEMAKILVARNREKYRRVFEDLLVTGCYAICDSWLSDTSIQPTGADVGEIDRLSTHLENLILQSALATFFSFKLGRFTQDKKPDHSFGERLVSDALARHFDRRLRSLLEDDRPRVEEFARLNLPTVFQLNLTEDWALEKRNSWKKSLADAGYDQTIRLLEDLGDLMNPDEVGQINKDRRDEINRAALNNDFERVNDLFSESAKELRSFLYREAQNRLEYQEPRVAAVDRDQRRAFDRAIKLVRSEDPDSILQALRIMQEVWTADIHNVDLRDWVAYLQAKSGNRPAAEKMLIENQKRRLPNRNFSTDWNLAVLAYDRKDETHAYNLLTPLVDAGNLDEDLVVVVLALSLKLKDYDRFLKTIPKTINLRFHPLAISIALETKNIGEAEDFLAQLMNQWQGKWQLPPVTEVFSKPQELERVVNRAIAESQEEQVVAWLEARINHNRGWVPNYLELARVLERELHDIDRTFEALRRRLDQVRRQKQRQQKYIDDACRDLLELCKRARRDDLGKQAYKLVQSATSTSGLLNSFEAFRTDTVKRELVEETGPKVDTQISEGPKPFTPIQDPNLSERLAWVIARLTEVRNMSSYVQEVQTINDFGQILTGLSPQETSTAVELINLSSSVIDTFEKSDPEDRDSRRVLYERASEYERRLSQLITNGALSQHLADIITPYVQALKRVVGDLSRQAGISPSVEAVIENPFISIESDRTSLVLRVTNQSQRQVSDVQLELLVDTPSVRVSGNRERRLDKLNVQKTRLLSFPIELQNDDSGEVDELSFGISLRASAEGFPNMDLGVKKQRIPIKAFKEAVGSERVPKLFFHGRSLTPSDADLFHGRNDVIDQIRDSFYGGVQRERLFLDGIRRVGKTSILNFLPRYLPENVIPILVNLDTVSMSGRSIDSASVLHWFSEKISEAVRDRQIADVDVPAQSSFSGAVFDKFLADVKKASPDSLPLLMIDEFQEILEAIARTGPEDSRDTVVLDQLRAQLDEGKLNALFTGSVRFSRLSEIINHRIFGSLKRLPVSFLDREGVAKVLRSGMEKWVVVPVETVDKVMELTGGYPWLLQAYGSGLVDLVNKERRTIVTPDDVVNITNEAILASPELFEYWWPVNQLSTDEERFVELLLRNHSSEKAVAFNDFMDEIHSTQRPGFLRAFGNLRACEVLDSTKNDILQFRGTVLRQWLLQHLQDGQLKIPHRRDEAKAASGRVGVFVDHENLIHGLERISKRRGLSVPIDGGDRQRWFSAAFDNIWNEIQRRFGVVEHHKVAVAFWSRPHEAILLDPYFRRNFRLAQPDAVKLESASDIMLGDEIRREREKARNEGQVLDRVIIVGADSDFAIVASSLQQDGVNLQVWGGGRDVKNEYISKLGEENFVVLDDVCGF
jgi:hypothetical protein